MKSIQISDTQIDEVCLYKEGDDCLLATPKFVWDAIAPIEGRMFFGSQLRETLSPKVIAWLEKHDLEIGKDAKYVFSLLS